MACAEYPIWHWVLGFRSPRSIMQNAGVPSVNPRIFLLTFAALAFGSGAYVFGGLLAPMADDLEVSVAAVGQLQAVFVVAAAIGGPVLTFWGGMLDRQKILVIALASVTVFTGLCAFVSGYEFLLALRILAGAAGGVIMPAAASAAAALFPGDRRGRAIALVLGGMTLAFLLGIPIGNLVGELFGWRATFIFASSLAGFACLANLIWLPQIPPVAATEKPRVEWLRAIPLVSLTLLSFASTMSVVSYIGPILELETGIQGSNVGVFQAVIGIGALCGLLVGGRIADGRRGRRFVMVGFGLIFLAQLIHFAELEGGAPAGSLTVTLVAWAIFSSALALFAIMPIVQARLISIAPAASALLLAVNGSMNYLGQGVGAGLGGLALRNFGPSSVALVGVAFGGAGLLLSLRPR